ncbi:MAG: hypothetical protein KDA21_04490 [Phycisphaerales bacterium]|nr:hypothetical protein [Phycisphaerales bacterium]
MSTDSSRPPRLGEVLVSRGVLTPEQVEHVLAVQQDEHRPFGLLVERIYGIAPSVVESAWAEQYAMLTGRVDIFDEGIEEESLRFVTRRQAWQFKVIPLRVRPASLTVATSPPYLARAMRFVSQCLTHPAEVVLTSEGLLGEALAWCYPLGGLGPEDVGRDPFQTLVS